MAEPSPSWRGRLGRWRWWIAAVALVVAVRVALPIVLRRVIVSQASQALNARVEVGDVDLALWKGGVALEDVAVYARAAGPSAGSGGTGEAHLIREGTGGEAAGQRAEGAATRAAATDNAAAGDAAATRGADAAGDAAAARDTVGAGGTAATKGIDATGGIDPAGDTVAAGGTAAIGDTVAAGGSAATVGTAAAGGTAAPGGTPAAGGTAAAGPRFPDNPPLIAFKRFAVEVHYLPLFSKTIQLRDVELEGPRVALDRLATGDLNVAALVPKSEVAVQAGATPGAAGAATPTAAAGAAVPSPWKFGLDRFVLRDGHLRFRDLALKGSEPVELGIDQVSVQEIALSPGVYGEPARMHVKLALDEGEIDVDSQLQLLAAGYAASFDVSAHHLPLRQARLYIPKVGWSDLKGELDLAVTYELQTDTKNALHGTLALRDVAVAVPRLEGVAVAWKSLSVGIDSVDLLAQRAAVSDVTLDGAKLDVSPKGDQPLPVLGQARPAAAAAATPGAQESPTPGTEAKPEPPPPAPPAKPWEWSVATVHVTDSTVTILSDQPPLEMGVELTATQLASAADAVAHVALGLALAPATVKVDGDLRIAAPAFGGTIQIADLALPPLVAVSGAVEPSVLPSATFKADLAVEAGLSAKPGATAEPNLLRVSGALGLSDLRASPPGQADLIIGAKSLDLTIGALTVPGVIPPGRKAEPGDALHLAAELKLQEPRVERRGEQGMAVGADALGLVLSDVAVPAAMAGLGPAEGPQPIHAVAKLDLTAPRVALASAGLSAEARAVSLAVADATIAAVPAGASAAGAAPAHVVAQLDLTEPKVAIAEGKQLGAGAQSIGLQVAELSLPGLVAGAPPSDTGQPVHAVATLTLAQPRAARADGKEFAVAAKTFTVRSADVSVPGVLAPPAAGAAAQPLRAAVAEVSLEKPALVITRTADGIVLPVEASAPAAHPAPPAQAPAPPAPAPGPASPPPEVTIAALRISNGVLDFTDRAVKPPFQSRFAPIEVDARNIRFPNPAVKPLRIEITSAEQGKITISGDLSPQGGALDVAVNDFALAPFNAYATSYSPYGIGDGALEIKTTAKFTGGKYEVSNALTLHQLDLTGAEGDSLFEQQFGIPLTMALALLRDASGDIDLNIPMQVDQSGGATVDVLTVVRSALRQAMMGAIESPLKLVGGVIGMGGKSGLAPAPIVFPLGRAEPSAAGAESAQRLAVFLTSRPGMAVELDTAVTSDDVRWLHEQALHGQWQDEGFVKRSFAFLTQRGPRERIGGYLAARAQGEKPELSPEDAATLQQWLDQQPVPTADQLQQLAAARLAAVDSVLRDKGIDAARISHGEPSSEPAQGAPVVKIKFRLLGAPNQARPGAPPTSEEGP